VGGCTARPPPFNILFISYKVAVYAPAERAVTLTLFHLYPYMYSVVSSYSEIFLAVKIFFTSLLKSSAFIIWVRHLVILWGSSRAYIQRWIVILSVYGADTITEVKLLRCLLIFEINYWVFK
jgi:hypothetical protein